MSEQSTRGRTGLERAADVHLALRLKADQLEKAAALYLGQTDDPHREERLQEAIDTAAKGVIYE